MRKRRVALGVVVSLICLGLAVAGIEWPRVGEAVQRADWRYLLPAGLALLGFLLARSVRWRVLLGSQVGLGQAFWVTNIGYLVSNVLPFRLGDPARAVAIGLGGKVKVSAALSTVVVERVLDMLTVVLLLAVTAPFVSTAGWIRRAGLLGGVLGLLIMALLVVLARRPAWGMSAAGWVLERVPAINKGRWLEWFQGLMDGLGALRSVQRTAAVMAWSVAVWALTVGHYLAMLRAFIARPSVVEASFLTSATGLGMALPSSPGAVGVFHSVARYALELPFGVAAETAVLVAFGSHTFQYVSACLLGLIGLGHQNLSLAALRAGAETRAASG